MKKFTTIEDIDEAIAKKRAKQRQTRHDPDELTYEEKMDRFEPDELGYEKKEIEEDDGSEALWNAR